MRNPLVVVALWVLTAAVSTGVGAGATNASRPIRMTVVGDSLAFGIGASDPTNALGFRVYRALLARRPGSEVTDLGIGGSRVADVTRLQVAEIAPGTEFVFVIAGGNDVVRRTPVARFAADAAALLVAIHRRVPHAVVVVCGVPDVARSPLFSDSIARTEALSRTDDAAVRHAGAEHGATVVDLFTYTRRHAAAPEFFSSDDFHPSDAGYAALARIVIPVVERATRDL